ncbi:MAG: hypothetical protein ACO3IB_00970 [Phycisphaerales bacterium]
MASKGSSVSKAVLIPLAVLSAFLLFHAFGAIPQVEPIVALWAASVGFALGSIMFGVAGSPLWCGLSAALAVVLNPIYPLPLGEYLTAAKIVGGVVAGAAVVRNW